MHGIGVIIAVIFILRVVFGNKGPRNRYRSLNVANHIVFWWGFVGPFTLITMPLMATGRPLWLAIGLPAALVWFGLPLSHHLLARFGWYRSAMALAFIGAIPWRSELGTERAIAGARACIALRRRRGAAPPEALTLVSERIGNAKILTGGIIVASGLLAVARGDRDRARALLASVASFPNVARYPRKLAVRWLVADAASRGDWARLVKLRHEFKDRLTRFTGAVGARLTHASADIPSNRRLWWYWLCSPVRLSTYTLLRAALADVPRATVATQDAPVFARHVAALKGGASDDALVKLAHDWEAMRPTLPLEAQSAIASDLQALAADRPQLASRHPAFNVMGRDGDPQSELEIAITSLRHRHDDKRDLPAIEEWAELVMLRELYTRAATDAPHQNLAFETAHLLIGNHAVHLQNERRERHMASAVYTWLEHEARLAGDDAFAAHYGRNAASCGV